MSFRSPALLSAVRELPCMGKLPICLGGSGQAAHSNSSKHGKGRGVKADDVFIASLCPACHSEIDHGKNMTRQQRIDAWQAAHERTLLALFEGSYVVPTGTAPRRETKYQPLPKIVPRPYA